MAIVSSHTLNAVDGTHAAGIVVTLTRLSADGSRTILFQTETDAGGRVAEQVPDNLVEPADDYELTFAIGRYFAPICGDHDHRPVVSVVVLRFAMPRADSKYHLPIIVSPHGYSVWWSN